MTDIEDLHKLSTKDLWEMLSVYVKNVGVPLKVGTQLPARARIIFKTLEKRLGLHSPDF